MASALPPSFGSALPPLHRGRRRFTISENKSNTPASQHQSQVRCNVSRVISEKRIEAHRKTEGRNRSRMNALTVTWQLLPAAPTLVSALAFVRPREQGPVMSPDEGIN
jgi:hypothetical protein